MKDDIFITAIFKSDDPAATAIAALLGGGVSSTDISIVTSEHANAQAFGIEKESKVGEAAAVGGGIGGALGAVVAGLTAIGSISTGGAGLLAAGPIMAALAGAGAGAAAGGLVGALIGLGIPQHRVKFVEDAIKKGAVLVGIRTSPDRRDWVERTLRYYSADALTLASATASKNASAKDEGSDVGSPGDNGLREVFLDQLKDIYAAEQTLLDALPEMRAAASSPALADAVSRHMEQTRNQTRRLERVFESLGMQPEAKPCPAMSGIITEAHELMRLDRTEAQRDTALICGAQKVEHYEMATYGCLVTFAKTLGLQPAAELLGQTLAEENDADRTLSLIAESGVNQSAA